MTGYVGQITIGSAGSIRVEAVQSQVCQESRQERQASVVLGSDTNG
jgi:hypothetical protein